jgi:hypothetical protein
VSPILEDYLDSLRALPGAPAGPTVDLTRLPTHEAAIWHTILPVAAAESDVDPATGAPCTEPAEALDRARRRAVAVIEKALRAS